MQKCNETYWLQYTKNTRFGGSLPHLQHKQTQILQWQLVKIDLASIEIERTLVKIG